MSIDWAVIGQESLNRLQVRILRALDEEGPDGNRIACSPSKLAGEFDEPLGNVSYHMAALAKRGWVVETERLPRRGAVEHFYALAEKVSL